MTGRILVVDDIPANVKLLEARLTAEYFDVSTALSGEAALEACRRAVPDLVLLDVMMPGLDGFEVCRRLKADPRTVHVPVVMVTALDQIGDRIKGLEAGADDFLTKPVNDLALVTRVKSLIRLKTLTDELRLRAQTGRDMGLDDGLDPLLSTEVPRGRILVVDDRRSSFERITAALAVQHEPCVETDPQQALFHATEGDFDLVIINLGLSNFDGLRLVSQLRSLERTRQLPILLIAAPDDRTRLLRGLEMGVNDYLVRPVDRHELQARVKTQIRRKHYADRLRDSLQATMEMAITDALTGLHNRRFLTTHLEQTLETAQTEDRALAVLIADMDHFKRVNDTYGHDGGDAVLKELALRMTQSVRGVDLVCRYGGEEFVVILPDTDLEQAGVVAERIRTRVGSEPFVLPDGTTLVATVSVGVGALQSGGDTVETIMKRADGGLYEAKQNGRNRVVARAA
ncbi:PleD family two-component system response regulator [Siculibacillus lacustris]|uniref:diguanylate cyclase n=1 Tax=Siculibacillus lacustris TaxID=1549641 RepID=A0A4Q9VGX1_9HYPH|nr:PleD family two-component system response regulator [Siculibacillus lacustris]TBW34305.1 PleD family two-component system response regulator [Siculibacillus lacustris]